MGAKRHTRESIIGTLQSLAANLGTTKLSKADVQRVLPVSSVASYFGSLGKALAAAGLDCRSQTEHLKEVRTVLADVELFESIQRVEQRLGHEPRYNEYCAAGEYSIRPFKKRFGAHWDDTLAYYRKWKANRASSPASADGDIPSDSGDEVAPPVAGRVISGPNRTSGKVPVQLYGEPFDFRGLRHAPINEQGVVYLFGVVSRELGFYVESIQQGFPDCEAKYLYDAKKNLWATARIGFEFRASEFKNHGHDPTQCDFIVCWVNDWPECPVRVIELKTEILKLPPR